MDMAEDGADRGTGDGEREQADPTEATSEEETGEEQAARNRDDEPPA